METERILSADSHVIEPADVWTARIDKRFADRAPRVIKNFGGREGDFFAAEGLRPFPVAGFAVAGVDPRDFAEKMSGGYPGVRPSAWDPDLRLKDQERDGVFAEVLYPSLGMRLFQLEDGHYGRRVSTPITTGSGTTARTVREDWRALQWWRSTTSMRASMN
jgi:uncharacterized protein